MARNIPSQIHAKGTPGTTGDAPGQTSDPQWEQLVLELHACCDNQSRQADEIAAAKYLSGECSEGERQEIEQAIDPSLNLPDCVILAQSVLRDMESAA
jgi:hypothetical protein